MNRPNPYRAAGTYNGPIYVDREADEKLLREISNNTRFPYLLAPRQSGKSSLIARTRERLSEPEYYTVFIDFSTFSDDELSNYTSFRKKFVLDLLGDESEDSEAPSSNIKKALRSLLSPSHDRIIIFLDEIDRLIGTPFKDSFFGLVRSIFNDRAQQPHYAFDRVQFVLAGAALPTQLIADHLQSPFNVGTPIVLSDLSIKQITGILKPFRDGGYNLIGEIGSRIHYHTNGSVYLTQLLLERLWERSESLTTKEISISDIDNQVDGIVQQSVDNIHFRNIFKRMTSDVYAQWAWRKLSEGGYLDQSAVETLHIIGISGKSKPYRNDIYRRVFGADGPLHIKPASDYLSSQPYATIGVITSLPIEFLAVKQLLGCQGDAVMGSSASPYIYSLANLSSETGGEHSVAVIQLSNINTARIVDELLHDFPAMKQMILCGIAGTTFDTSLANSRVRLGDVVVADEVWTGKNNGQDHIAMVSSRRAVLDSDSELPTLFECAQAVESREGRSWEYWSEKASTDLGPTWHRPIEGVNGSENRPHIIFGPIASSTYPRESNLTSEEVSKKLLAVDFETAAISSVPFFDKLDYLVVCGICDKIDSHVKNDAWQGYAALNAAAYTRAVIHALPLAMPTSIQPPTVAPHFSAPWVFVSYTHDSPEHVERILELSNRLRTEGIDCHLDRYYEASPPPEGWPEWMLRQIESADFVLVVCTEPYHRHFRRREEPDNGLGAQWNGAVITQSVYNAAARTGRFVPVGFEPYQRAKGYIPLVLQGTSYYDLSTSEGYENLYRHLTSQPGIQPPALGSIRSLPIRRTVAGHVGDEATGGSRTANVLPPAQTVLSTSPLPAGEIFNESNYLLESIVSVVSQVVGSAPAQADPTPLAEADAKAQQRIDSISRMLEDHHAIAARDELAVLRSEMWNRVSSGMRAKIANNEGVAALRLDDLSGALRRFQEAVGWDPTNPKILANVAQVALLSGRYQEALEHSERALALDPVSETAASVFLQALDRTGNYDLLARTIADEKNRWMSASSATCRAALASIYHGRGDYKRAEELIKGAIESSAGDSRDPQYHMLLASIIATPILRQLNTDRRNHTELTPYERVRVGEAEQEYSKAAQAFERTDSRRWFHSALLSRAGIRHLLGRSEEALHDCDRVLGEDSSDRGALETRGRILLQTGNFREAAKCLERAVAAWETERDAGLYVASRDDAERRLDVRQLLCEAYLNSGQAEAVVDLLGPVIAPNEPQEADDANIAKAEMVLYAATQLQRDDIQAAAIAYLQAVQGADDRIQAILSNYYDHQGDTEKAIYHQRAAVEAANGTAKGHYQLNLARLLYHQERFLEAADLFRPLVDGRDDHPSLPMFAASLYYAGLYPEALENARRIRLSRGVMQGVSEIEVDILERVGDIDAAREVLTRLVSAYPREYKYKVRLAALELRAGQRVEAVRLAEQIPYEAIADDVTMLMNVARLRLLLDLPEVLRYGYRARRLAFGSADMHLDYMTLCFNMDANNEESNEVLGERETVGVADAVTLQRDGQEITFILESEEPIFPERGEMRPDDVRATRLIGHKQGDTVILREGLFGPEEYLITEIKSKYLYASHETTHMFQEGRLEHSSLSVMNVSQPEFFERFWKFLDRRSENNPDIFEMYRTGPMPFATFSRLVHRSVLDVWLAMTEWPAARIFAFAGTQQDMERQKEMLADDLVSVAVSLDLMALLTIIHTNLEEAVRSRFSRILIAQHVMDELKQYELEIEHNAQPIGTIGSRHGERYFIETPTQHVEHRKSIAQRMIAFVRDVSTVMPVLTLLDVDMKVQQFLGNAALSSVVLAKEQNAMLYSDDLRLRIMAEQMFEVYGVDTQGVLADMDRREIVLSDKRYAILAELAQCRYYFVSISVDAIVSLLKQNGFQLVPPLQAAIATLEGPDSDQESAVQIVAEVIKRVWVMNLLPHQKSFVLEALLTTLVKGRRRADILNRLLAILPGKFYLVPQYLIDVRNMIALWNKVRETSPFDHT